MSLVDSAAAFKAHCNVIDGSGALRALLEGNNLTTFSQQAFAAGTPQAPLSDEAFKEFGSELNGGVDLTIAALARLRRLHFEAQALVVARLKSQVSADSSGSIRKLPLASIYACSARGTITDLALAESRNADMMIQWGLLQERPSRFHAPMFLQVQ